MINFVKSRERAYMNRKTPTLMPQGIKCSKVGLNLIPGFAKPKPPKPGVIHRFQLTLALTDAQYASVFYDSYCKMFPNRTKARRWQLNSRGSEYNEVARKEYNKNNESTYNSDEHVDYSISNVESIGHYMDMPLRKDALKIQKPSKLKTPVQYKRSKPIENITEKIKPKQEKKIADSTYEHKKCLKGKPDSRGNKSLQVETKVLFETEHLLPKETTLNRNTSAKSRESKRPHTAFAEQKKNDLADYNSDKSLDSSTIQNGECSSGDVTTLWIKKKTGMRKRDDVEKKAFNPGSKIKEAYKLSLVMAQEKKESTKSDNMSTKSASSSIPRPVTRNSQGKKADGSRIAASLRVFMDRYKRARELKKQSAADQ